MNRCNLLMLLMLCSLLTGCITRQVITPVVDKRGIEVELRGQKNGNEPVDKGYAHPAAISPQRISYILTTIEVRGSTGKKDDDKALQGIVTATTLQDISKGLSEALAQADSSQEVVIKSVRTARRLGVFSRKFYSGFTAYVEDDYLYIHVSYIEKEIDTGKGEKLPMPLPGKANGKFRVVANKGMHAVGPYALAIRWRDPHFSKQTRSLDTEGVRTRTILLDSPIPKEELGATLPTTLSDKLSPATLRALADLEEERRNGLVTEAAYRFRRDQLLRGAGGN